MFEYTDEQQMIIDVWKNGSVDKAGLNEYDCVLAFDALDESEYRIYPALGGYRIKGRDGSSVCLPSAKRTLQFIQQNHKYFAAMASNVINAYVDKNIPLSIFAKDTDFDEVQIAA